MRRISVFVLVMAILFSIASSAFAGKDSKMSDNEKYVRTLYRDILGRAGNDSGVLYWTEQLNQGKNRTKVVEAFLNSSEYRNRFVTYVYGWCHDRRPEPDGLNYWAEKMKTSTEGDIIKDFCKSTEFWNNSNENYKDFVTNLYWTLQSRRPNESGLRYWVGKLREGETREWVVEKFISSSEYQGKYVIFLFDWYLDREPEPEALKYWKEQLKELGERGVIMKILTGKEYWNKVTK
ncbi:MAG: DUF4214 domain-containing protein [candidate division Zixibacteria bacterium]|nr:DUF4214 domain-containing protein [Candidatus Tariuqbacter arcticus]